MQRYKLLTKGAIVTFYGAMMCIMFMQVIMRYIFNLPTTWAEEISRYCFVWVVYLSAAMGISTKVHLGVDYLLKHLSLPTQRKIFLFTAILSFLLFLFVFIQGIRMTILTMGFPCFTVSFIPQGFAYLAIPVGFFLMMVAIAETIYEKINEKNKVLLYKETSPSQKEKY